jgi:cysteine desulfurase/selenocysteine lyase
MPTKLGGGVTFNLKLNQKVVLKTPPYVFEGGTPNINGACGLLASINYLNFLGYKALRLQTIKMHFFFKKSILNVYVKDLVFIPKLSSNYLFHKNPVFLFINNKHSHDVSHHLNLFNLAIRSGFQCNQPLIEGGLKTHTVSRASYCMYNCFRCIRGFILNLKRNNF